MVGDWSLTPSFQCLLPALYGTSTHRIRLSAPPRMRQSPPIPLLPIHLWPYVVGIYVLYNLLNSPLSLLTPIIHHRPNTCTPLPKYDQVFGKWLCPSGLLLAAAAPLTDSTAQLPYKHCPMVGDWSLTPSFQCLLPALYLKSISKRPSLLKQVIALWVTAGQCYQSIYSAKLSVIWIYMTQLTLYHQNCTIYTPKQLIPKFPLEKVTISEGNLGIFMFFHDFDYIGGEYDGYYNSAMKTHHFGTLLVF